MSAWLASSTTITSNFEAVLKLRSASWIIMIQTGTACWQAGRSLLTSRLQAALLRPRPTARFM